jgi:uracil phosphoribosyltransferase
LTDLEVQRAYDRVEIIDGAIASGATLMTVMECMTASTRVFDIYSVHATAEGLRALSSFARIRKLDLTMFIGHVTAGLNDHFYAIDSGGSRLVVGDLGDTISDLPETNSP